MRGRWGLRALGAAGVGLLSLLPGAPPAGADCVYLLVFVGRQNDSNVYGWGPDSCVTETGWDNFFTIGPIDVGHDTYDGLPNRVYTELRIPAP